MCGNTQKHTKTHKSPSRSGAAGRGEEFGLEYFVCPALQGRVIAIDAKSVRGSGLVVRGAKALHLISAYATEVGVMLAQQRREEKIQRDHVD
jgi:hypothetical protein